MPKDALGMQVQADRPGTRCNRWHERLENISKEDPRGTGDRPTFFTFPEDARWNADRQAVEFGVEIGEYHGVVRLPRRVFQRLLPERPTPERCVEAYYLQRTRFERVVERKLRRADPDMVGGRRSPIKSSQPRRRGGITVFG
jgi:hypothetical protein